LFHPFGFGFEQVFCKLGGSGADDRTIQSLAPQILGFGEKYSTGVGGAQKKVGFRQHFRRDCRGDATT
jgi:hypothetical protein